MRKIGWRSSSYASLFGIPLFSYIGLRQLISRKGGEYIANSLEQDMKDPFAYYMSPRLFGRDPVQKTCFWVAALQAESAPEKVVGCVALDTTDRPAVTDDEKEMKLLCPPRKNWGELRRMCVDSSQRRLGTAGKLHAALRAFAETSGFEGVTLTTSSAQPEARALYSKIGYAEVRVQKVPIPILGQAVGIHTFELQLRESQ